VDQHLGYESIVVDSDSPGTCHVTWMYEDGTTASTDIVFTPIWQPCGSDPHGCGQGVTTSPLGERPGADLRVTSTDQREV
jgi:hypothetical protein